MTDRMELADHLTALRQDGPRLAQAAATAGLDAPVPTCPEWVVRDLLHHVGGVHRWASSYVLTSNPQPTTAAEDTQFFVRVADEELLGWFRDGHAALVAAINGAKADLQCWSFLPAPSPLRFWARRQAHETAVHRADAEAAAGWPSTCDRDFAADGIDELLNGFLARRRGRLVADPAVALGVEPTDGTPSWTLRIEPDRRVTSPGIEKADCRLRGASADLYLYLWNRLPADTSRVEVVGDRRVVDLWRERATIRWD